VDADNSAIVDRLVTWYAKLPQRQLEDITTVVLHATEIPELKEAWDFAMSSAENEDDIGVCGHLYLDRDGTCYRFVPLDRIANHARGFNSSSIGIELVNTGRYPAHFDTRYQNPSEPFPELQIISLKRILMRLKATWPNLEKIVRHSDLDQELVSSSNDSSRWVQRRIDPGPRFPWEEIKSFWNNSSSLEESDRGPRVAG
jgi:N-acetylmuramoyl-L-alanine amidase